MGCNRLTKWWYLQDIIHLPSRRAAVTGLQNGGIYKSRAVPRAGWSAVTGLQNGGIYKEHGVLIVLEGAVTGLQNDGNMSNKNKRESIIEACSKEIETIPFITSDGVEFRMADAYICPLCQHVYAIAHEALTLEHVPPESVGGKPILVTCKACNNSQGADLDVYLMNELEISHNLSHLDTIPQKSRIAFNGIEINAQTTFSKSEGFKFMISPDNNNPIEFEGFMKEARNAKEGYEIKFTANITNRKRNVDLANIALLKSAYLMAFQELGYMYVLNPCTKLEWMRR